MKFFIKKNLWADRPWQTDWILWGIYEEGHFIIIVRPKYEDIKKDLKWYTRETSYTNDPWIPSHIDGLNTKRILGK